MTVDCDCAVYIWVLSTAVKFPTMTQTVIDNRETCLCAKSSGMDGIINLKTDLRQGTVRL